MTSTTGVRPNVVPLREERAELPAVLALPTFARWSDLCRILTFACEGYFEGESATVKEYTADFSQK
jgi:hypothetical protein